MKIKALIQSDKFYVLADQVVVSAGAFLSNLLLARALGINEYGRFASVGLIQLFALSLFMATGSQVYQVVYPGLNKERKSDYTSGLFYCLLIMIVAASLFFTGIFLMRLEWLRNYEDMAAWSIMSIGLYLLQDFLRKALITSSKEKQAFYSDSITNLLQLASLFILWKWDILNSVNAWIVIGITFIPSIAAAVFWLKISWPKKNDLLLTMILHRGKSSWLLLSAFLQWCSGYFFVLAAGWWISAAALGALRLSQYIFGLLNVLLQAIENYTLPRLVQSVDKPAYLRQLLKQLSMLMFPLLATISLFADKILWLAGGESYRGYEYVIYGLTIVYVLITVGYPVRMAIRATHMNKQFFNGYVLSVVFSVGSAALLIRNWELYGVIIGLIGTQIINVGYWLFVLKGQFQHKLFNRKKLSS